MTFSQPMSNQEVLRAVRSDIDGLSRRQEDGVKLLEERLGQFFLPLVDIQLKKKKFSCSYHPLGDGN